jgi:hypothetical protein
MDRWLDDTVVRLTLVSLTGGFCLIAAGTADVAASPLLAVGLFAAAAGLRALGVTVANSDVAGRDTANVAPVLWTGPAVAGAVVLLWLDATPGEVQALGGLIGLVGMANYFLRPVYHVVLGFGRRLASV